MQETPQKTTTILKTLFLAYLVYLTWFFASADMNGFIIYNTFLHLVNLIFHEAGHFIFMPFGETLHILGGSLTQVLVPLIVLVVFWYRDRRWYEVGFALWWVGQNLVDIAPYIADSRAQMLDLLGGQGVLHDWRMLLAKWDLLYQDEMIASVVNGVGIVIMIAGLLLSLLAIILPYFRNLDIE
jgi:hypothetical protein